MSTSGDNGGGEDGFLQRWSRRKRGEDVAPDRGDTRDGESIVVTADGEAPAEHVRVLAPLGAGRMIVEPADLFPEPEGDEQSDGARDGEGADENADAGGGSANDTGEAKQPTGEVTEAEIAEMEAIDIDAMDYDADFTKFMRAGVPEALRRRALRKLWTTNPILANLDGMNDYDEDFTDAKLAVEVLQTAFKPIGGYMNEEEIAAQERLGREHLYDEDGNFIGEQTEVAEGENGTDTTAEAEAETAADEDDTDTAAGDGTDDAVADRQDGHDNDDDDDDELDDDGDTEFG